MKRQALDKLFFLIIIFFVMFIVLLIQRNTLNFERYGRISPLYINLMEQNAYARRGFDQAQIKEIPNPNINNEWVLFGKGSRIIRNAPLADMQKSAAIISRKGAAEEFTIIIPVEFNLNAIAYLNEEAMADILHTAGVYFAGIGENWEIYFNGSLIRSEMHFQSLGSNLFRIQSSRFWRDVYVPIDRALIVPGTNILALRIIGDPVLESTGLRARLHYIDSYRNIIGRQHNIFNIVLSTIFGFSAVSFLLIFLYIKSRQEIYYLFFGIFSFMLCIYSLMRHGTINAIIPDSNIARLAEYISLILLFISFTAYVEISLRRKITIISKCYYLFCLVLAFFQIFILGHWGEEAIMLFNTSILIYINYIVFYDIVYLFIFDKKRQRYDTEDQKLLEFYVIFGTLTIYFFALFEITGFMFLYDILPFRASAPFINSAVAIQIGMTFMLSRRFSILYNQLMQSNIILETTVQKRTEQLEEQIGIAIQASKAKTDFLANMSHEIRTPMNSIFGFAELALEDGIPPKTREYLGNIKKNTEGLLQIIDDILDITKVESGRLELEFIPFDLYEILSHCQSVMMAKALEKDIDLRFSNSQILELSANNKKMLGDPLRLRQILFNIISNAIKFTETGFVEVLTQVKNFSSIKNTNSFTIHFAIQDTGIGMSSEQKERILEPFFQADSSITRKYGGTGLGLSISKNLIELMGGELFIESHPDIGSTFSFDIDFELADESQLGLSDKNTKEEIKKPLFDGEVLVCEDNPWNQHLISEHLTRVGLRAVIAKNGREGVNIFMQRAESANSDKTMQPFNLVFMDIYMPIMDGLEAASLINQIDPKIPIVAMTANIMAGDLERYKRNGMVECLGKPFSSQDLWRCLSNYFETKSCQNLQFSAEKNIDQHLKERFRRNFLRDNKTKYLDIAAAMEKGDMELAKNLLHTLRGNVALIEKTGLQKTCAEMEEMVKTGGISAARERLEQLKIEFNAILEELSREAAAPQPETILNRQQTLELLEKLQTMLSNRDPMCINLLDNIRTIPGTKELVYQMENYLLKQAQITLAKFIQKWRS